MFNFLDIPPDLQVGAIAPDFTLSDAQGQSVHLYEQLQNHWVVLFFYPKDQTPGCTRQACSFRDVYSEFRERNVALLGISADSEASHQAFTRNQKLPYPLLSDPKGHIARAYGVKKALGLLPGRVTFVIAPDHTVRLAYASQLEPESHARKALELIKSEMP